MQTQHTCGYPIWFETVWNGIAYRPIFKDGSEDSQTAGERVYDCPRCGEHMLASDFHHSAASNTELKRDLLSPFPNRLTSEIANGLC